MSHKSVWAVGSFCRTFSKSDEHGRHGGRNPLRSLIGAERYERAPEERAMHRNGHRPRRRDTRTGEIELQIPKLPRARRAS